MAHADGLVPATVVAAHAVRANGGNRAEAVPERRRYDVVLDVHRGADPPERVQLLDVELGDVVPLMGSTVRVARDGGGNWEIRWRGDPNLDVEAHRAQLAKLAERAPRRAT